MRVTVLHSLMSRSRKSLLLLLLMDKRLRRCEATRVEANICLVLSKRVVRKVHVNHIIAEAAFFR
jgi:hypothetical protein